MDILDGCKSLNDVSRKLYGKVNYTNREKVKKLLSENGIDWKSWVNSAKNDFPKVFCKYCGNEIPDGYKKKKQFCDSSCAAKYNNRGRVMPIDVRSKISKTMRKDNTYDYCGKCGIEQSSNDDTTPIKHCLNCGKEISLRNKYCSNKCQGEYHRKTVIEKWKDGKYDGIVGEYSLSVSIKSYLLEKHDYKCELCGWGEVNPYTGTIPLEIHHRDGDYTNNKEENLQVLCPNCHSLNETHKSHNKNGRKARKRYYANKCHIIS